MGDYNIVMCSDILKSVEAKEFVEELTIKNEDYLEQRLKGRDCL